MEKLEEVTGIGTLPNLRLLIAAAVVSLLVVGVVTLFFVLFRPIEQTADVEVPMPEKPAEEPAAAEPPEPPTA